MVGVGVILLVALYCIYRSQNELLRGGIIPLALLLILLIGYGSYILYSRPAHATASIVAYKEDPKKALVAEKTKHITDNKTGKTLTKYVYPALIILSALALFFVASLYSKGMALGFIFLFSATYVIDSGFVSRSDSFIAFIDDM